MKCILDTMVTDDDIETNQHGGTKMIPGLIVLGLVFLTLLYAVQTSTGMAHRAIYPLWAHRPDGSMELLSTHRLLKCPASYARKTKHDFYSTSHHTVAGDESNRYFHYCDERLGGWHGEALPSKTADESQEERMLRQKS